MQYFYYGFQSYDFTFTKSTMIKEIFILQHLLY